jgi:transposase
VLRNDLPEWASAANCSSQQMTLRRLKKAFDVIFHRVKSGQTLGFPLFKSLNRFPGFSLKSHGDGWRFTPEDNWKHGSLRLSGVGQNRRAWPSTSRRRDSSQRSAASKWSVVPVLDSGHWHTQQGAHSRWGDGLRLGVETFLSGVTHAGEVIAIDNPRWWQADKDKIVALQREVSSKTQQRSHRRRKAVAKLSQAKAKTARRRLNWMHQTSAQLAQRFALVASEKLDIARMTRSASGTEESPGKKRRPKGGLEQGNTGHSPRAGSPHSSVAKCRKLAASGWRHQRKAQALPAVSAMLECAKKDTFLADTRVREVWAHRTQRHCIIQSGVAMGFGIQNRWPRTAPKWGALRPCETSPFAQHRVSKG